MGLKIHSFKLNSFKSYSDTLITFNDTFNVIIGENNVGKTTIFEAILLWKKCYDMSLQAKKKKFYKDSINIYLNFEDLYFMRLTQDTDIFLGSSRTCSLCLTLIDEETSETFSLGFSLTRPSQAFNTYLRCDKLDSHEFDNFEEYARAKATNLDNMIYFHQTKPVSNILSREPYMYMGQIKKKIEKGKSNEVLRNKILNSATKNKGRLENQMKNVLGYDISFELPPRTKRDTDEYINLKVKNNGTNLDILLQGTGFLQVAEIFSTIDIFENTLNVLLIDEPDSHINPRIQENLLRELKTIYNTQTFVISHNDNFASNLAAQEIIFINSEKKASGTINPLTDAELDSIHFAMGGVITSLTALQKAKKIVFVEGKDDIKYIKALYNRVSSFLGFSSTTHSINNLEEIAFSFVRGKDYMAIKLMNYKNLFSQLVRNKTYCVLYDKDFSTEKANSDFQTELKGRLGSHSSAYSHNGYCIESVLFSDDSLLMNFLHKVTGVEPTLIENSISEYKAILISSLRDNSSEKYRQMKEKFKSQRTEARPELSSVEFDTYAPECIVNYQYAMNKDNIKEFICHFESQHGSLPFNHIDESSEFYASSLLNLYINSITQVSDIYPGYSELLSFIFR